MTTDAAAPVSVVTPTSERRWSEAVEDYVQSRSLEVITPRYLQELRRVLQVVGRELASASLPTSPGAFGETHLTVLLRGSLHPTRVAGATRTYVLCILRGFLIHEGNHFLSAQVLSVERREN